VATKKRSKEEGIELLRQVLSAQTPRAVEVLVELMNDTAQKPELRMKAAESILDRACGKALVTQSGTASEPPTSIVFEGVLEEWSR
jgi:hypothetical protein